uniref:Lipid phosphate phosphohydrolase 1 n=1 Tax=Phallusia mammillata TaxID=59560 RepID=A0A6F9DNQ1_9ASCI|nr:lipid phosphate phosphohydrolase 1 [Phallusia mammillata]
MDPTAKRDILKVLLDLFCYFIFLIPLWVYNLLDVVPLTMNGFFCSDITIRFPYRNSTLSSTLLFVSGCGFMLITVLVVETLLFRRRCPMVHNSFFHPLVCNIYRAVGYAIVGGCINQFLTDIGKQSVGRMRPHFFDLCQPDVNCTDANQFLYITDYKCMRTSHPQIPQHNFHERMLDARKSFPSGHASFAFYMALYVVMYLEYRMTSQRTRLARHLVQTGVIAWAVWICCSRVFDFKHRFSDVLAGCLLGTLVAMGTVYAFFMSVQKTIPPKSIDVESNGDVGRTLRHATTPINAGSSLTNLKDGDVSDH